MNGTHYDYDLVVIGTGPGGQKAAIAAAKAGHRVAIVEKKAAVGGTCINTGTIPSKSLREAVLYLSGWREHTFYGSSYAVKRDITIADLLVRANYVISHELDVIQHQMYRNDVDLIRAVASFSDPHTLDLAMLDNSGSRRISAAHIVIATGTDAAMPHDCTIDDTAIFTSDAILRLDRIPRTLAVIGAGVIGCEYASMFAALGVRVILVDARPDLLSFIDGEIADALAFHLRENNVTLRLGETVSHVERMEDGHVATHLKSGKHFITEKALYSVGRVGATAGLNLPSAGLEADDRGRLVVNEHYQTSVPHIYAVGDVIGFPALASTSMEQGRLAASHAFGLPASSVPALFPYGIYTIPEISMVGRTEADLTKDGVPYEVGKANYKEIARGQIIGDQVGMLKLIFHSDTAQLLGAHIIGEGASELIHIGQAVLSFGGTADYFVNTVFNYPTLAECYKVAAFDALNRMRG
jgi:NAD(P) transhydrogenase